MTEWENRIDFDLTANGDMDDMATQHDAVCNMDVKRWNRTNFEDKKHLLL